MNNNKNLHEAKRAKNDEFYTLYEVVEKEMQYYDFQGKVVYCNCDDYRKSNFVRYFKDNYVKLGLSKLICTAYNEEGGIAQIYKDGWAETIHLFGDGSYDSDECIEYLKESDVVVTNPPFSKFRDYFKTLMNYDKKFIILGSLNGITYKNIFPYIKNKQLWFGETLFTGKMPYFKVPDDYVATNERIIEKDGKKYKQVNNICWYTNVRYNKQIKELILTQRYNDKLYPKYDNYDAINVDKVKDIPIDYDKYMGVPITALKYLNTDGELEFSEEVYEVEGIDRYIENNPEYGKRFKIDDKEKYARIIIKKNFEVEDEIANNTLTMIDGKPKYARVIIKKKFEIIGTTDNCGNGELDDIKKEYERYDAPVIDGKVKYTRIIIKSK